MFSINELHQYSSTVRRAFLEKLASLPWETITKNREASYYSMKDIMLHMIDNEDMVVSRQILKVPDYKRARDWKEYGDMRMIREHLDEVEKRTKAYLESADEKELGRRVTFTVSSGSFDLSAEECLMQSFTEQLYHLGELIALLWQENIEPPRMQWFWNNPKTQTSDHS
ncbi:MAG: DinB family protein [Thaumarchaeota archaeon]|nr:DinB family protein [Nitrososphaerota archaeon]